jgi:hypothetical protein
MANEIIFEVREVDRYSADALALFWLLTLATNFWV